MNENIPPEIPASAAKATFAGGCFWCVESAFKNQEGVYNAISGYTGGNQDSANYREAHDPNTGHREAVQVYYDPEKVPYEKLLEIFWRQIDPTDDSGQFADRGFIYTTAIFYHTEEQKKIAELSKEALANSGKFKAPIATKIIPASEFFPAEEEHQDFAQKRPEYYHHYKTGSGRAGYIKDTWNEQ